MQVSELSVRAHPVGPPLALRVASVPAGATPAGRASAMILIHGYNVAEQAARQAYAGFLSAMETVAASPPAIPVFEFFWPGDEVSKIVSALSFSGKIDVARQAAELLCGYLAEVHGPDGGPIDIHFVAHSLGNRLLLQLLACAARFPKVVVRSVTLMAAAVPVEMVAYRNLLYEACLVPRFAQVLHSRSDAILHWAFPAGETMHGEAFFPVAIGRYGQPAGNWRGSHAFDGFGHGDYWKKPGPPALVLQQLGVGGPRLTAAASVGRRATASRATGG